MESPAASEYVRSAALEPLNILAFAVACVVSVAKLSWWPLLAWSVAEAAYLLIVPGAAGYRRLVRLRRAQRALLERQRRREQLVMGLDTQGRRRFRNLVRECDRAQRALAAIDTALADTAGDQVQRLESLLDTFVQLGVQARQSDEHIARTSPEQLRAEAAELTTKLETTSPGDPSRSQQIRQLELLNKRLAHLERLQQQADAARAQMDLIEQTFGLIADQMMSIQSPEAVQQQLDDVVARVEAAEEVSRETGARLLEARQSTRQ